jgi:hypothetical protein
MLYKLACVKEVKILDLSLSPGFSPALGLELAALYQDFCCVRDLGIHLSFAGYSLL